MTKHATSFRLSPEALRHLAALAKRLGLSQAAVLELAIRQLARKERD
jgi:predicted DNA-binding protein